MGSAFQKQKFSIGISFTMNGFVFIISGFLAANPDN